MNFVFVVFKKPLRLYKYSGAPQFDPHGHVIAVKWKESMAVALAFQNCAVGDFSPGLCRNPHTIPLAARLW